MTRMRSSPAWHAVLPALVVSLALAVPSTDGDTIHVRGDGPHDPAPWDPSISDPDEDGSEEHPFDAIQEALDVAVDGDEVVVWPGSMRGEGNRKLDFLAKALTLRSLYGSNITWINGEDQFRLFHLRRGEGPDSVIEGFGIWKGRADAGSTGGNNGGAILCENSSPTFRDCVIKENEATGAGCAGGAIACRDGSNPVFTGCTIRDNSATFENVTGIAYGGAIACYDSNPAFDDCTIENNSVLFDRYSVGVGYVFGGAISCERSAATFTNCSIESNQAGAGSSENQYAYGGAFYCYDSAPTLTGCSITSNIAEGLSSFGGAIYCELDGDPTLDNCTIVSNRAYWDWQGHGAGGGVYCVFSSPTFKDCVVTYNSASDENGYGGGICCEWDANPTIAGCTITSNGTEASGAGIYCRFSSPQIINTAISDHELVGSYAESGAGMYCAGGSPALVGCTVTMNIAENDGGGIYATDECQLTVLGSDITDNTADCGAGLYCEWDSVTTVHNCLVAGNTATGTGGGIGLWYECGPSIRNCVIAHNQADVGGGVYAHFYSSPLITGSTIADNIGVAGAGGLHASYGGSLEVTNSVLWGNQGQITLDAFGYYPVQLTVSYSDVQGGQVGVVNAGCTLIWGDGNIDTDPSFADAGNGDYHLTTDSVCIDTGDPAFAAQPLETDIDGQARLWDGDDDQINTVDMGADEFGSFPYGDLNCDAVVDAYDIDAFLCALSPNCNYQTQYPGCSPLLADCNGDGIANAYDIDGFIDLLGGV